MKLAKFDDTGWENLSGANVRARIKNGWAIVVVEDLSVKGTQSTEVTIMTLPEKYWPAITIRGVAHTNSLTTEVRWLTVKPSGRLTTIVQNANGSENLVGSICYPV